MALDFTALQNFVKRYESRGGDYTAVNPTSGASGAYQFLDSTWAQYAPQIGVDLDQYPSAASAPPAVQDAVFNNMVSQRGLADYTCPGCSPQLTNDFNAIGGLSAFDTSAQTVSPDYGSGYGSNGSSYVAADPSFDPYGYYSGTGHIPIGSPDPLFGTAEEGAATVAADVAAEASPAALVTATGASSGKQVSVGIQPGTESWFDKVANALTGGIAGAIQKATGAALGSAEEWFVRGLVIIVGLVLVALALNAVLRAPVERTVKRLRLA